MYKELYAAWRSEIENSSLAGLPPDFYARIADYMKHISEDGGMLDKKSVKVNLQNRETQNVKRMLEELLWARYRKLIETITAIQKVPADLLTVEETNICQNFTTFAAAYQKFTEDLLKGQMAKTELPKPDVPKSETESSRKRVTLRFVKSTPAIIGLDMKAYGPFMVEDVASLPEENAKILVKHGLAVLVQVS
jgi:DNA replication initiation complex subunit (GINS family)